MSDVDIRHASSGELKGRGKVLLCIYIRHLPGWAVFRSFLTSISAA